MFKKSYKLEETKLINNFNKSTKVTNNEGIFEVDNNLEYSNNNNSYYKENLILKSQLDEEKYKNSQLMNELKLQKEKMNEIMSASENIIAIIFKTIELKINFPIACKSSDDFSTVEEKLFKEFPELRDNELVFIANGNSINRKITVEKNGIKNGDTILVDIINKE